MLYTRPQLRLLLVLAAALLAGLGVSHWRAGFPALADRLERFDRDEPGPSAFVDDGAGAPAVDPPGSRGAGAPARARGTPGPPAPVDDPRPLDLNRASVEQLARLPGVGPALAARVAAERERRGRFESPEDLRRVLGFGPKKLALVRDLVRVEAPPRAVSPRAPAPAADAAPRADEPAEPATDAR